MQLMDPAMPHNRPELLVLRALKLGDLLVAVPAVHGLRRAFPEHRLILAVPQWLAPIADLIGGVDSLLPTPGLNDPLPLTPGRIDVAVNMHGNGSESRSIITALGARVSIVHDPPGPQWANGIHERERWVRLVRAYGIGADAEDLALEIPTVAPRSPGATIVHVGAFYGSRQWPMERFARVATTLADDGHEVWFTGSGKERERALRVAELAGLPEATVLAGRLTLDEFAAEVAAARLVISADTGAAHLASAYGIPSVVLFGPAPPEEWGPPRSGPHIVLTDSSKRLGETFSATPDPAIMGVTVEQVLSAARSLSHPRAE
jgi:ADP-heptose:LPS heptosyltransferase